MSEIGTSGFNSFSTPLSQFDPSAYRSLVEVVEKFTVQTHSFKKKMAAMGVEIDKLQVKLDANPSNQNLKQIIAKKEQALDGLDKVLEEIREGYFSTGKAVGDQMQAFLNITV